VDGFPPDFRLVLASQSPRRHTLLRDVGVPFTVVPSHAVEVMEGGTAEALAQLNAQAKVNGAVVPAGLPVGAFVLGTDTLVTTGGAVMGKPSSAGEAADMLRRLSGRVHQVVSGVALLRTTERAVGAESAMPPGRMLVSVATTDVTFRDLSAGDVDAYVDSGEWKGKAGGYAIQGIAAFFANEIRGEYSNVMGMPLCLLGMLFTEQGFDLVGRRWLYSENSPLLRIDV